MAKPTKLVIYRDGEGLWRWRAIKGNWRKDGASEQGYARRSYARMKAERAYPDGIVVYK